jgi:alpha-1,3/alpha-1,6-mannosyltransferase
MYRDKQRILSINRFERKKNIALAISSFAAAKDTAKNFSSLQLVLAGNLLSSHFNRAGGYDDRVAENVQHLAELQEQCDQHGLTHAVFSLKDQAARSDTNVLFLPSFSNAQRSYLLSTAKCLVYTPSNEHFGIVPLEAMYSRLPVLAVNNGGPLGNHMQFA